MATTTEDIPQYDGPADYRGPKMSWLMQHHKLAEKIIETHKDRPADILDNNELALLRDYVNHQDKGAQLLESRGMKVTEPYSGSLVAYCIAKDAFDDGEKKMLKEWFDSGNVDEDLKGFGKWQPN